MINLNLNIRNISNMIREFNERENEIESANDYESAKPIAKEFCNNIRGMIYLMENFSEETSEYSELLSELYNEIANVYQSMIRVLLKPNDGNVTNETEEKFTALAKERDDYREIARSCK